MDCFYSYLLKHFPLLTVAFILLVKISLFGGTGTVTNWDYNRIVLFLVVKVVALIEWFFFKQECVFMGKTSSSVFGKWVATDCNSTHGFICSRDVGEFNWTLWTCWGIVDILQAFTVLHILLQLCHFFHVQILVFPQCLLKFLKTLSISEIHLSKWFKRIWHGVRQTVAVRQRRLIWPVFGIW